MVLKEAYRYQNYLDKLIINAESLLANKRFVTNTVENHNRSKANSDAADEKVELYKDEYEYSPMQIVDLLVKLIDEKEKLSAAIADTKKKTAIDIDSSMAMNKMRQLVITSLTTMANIKPATIKRRETGYKMNPVDGTQIPYYYEVESITTINFDRNDVKGIIKKYKAECDKLSSQKDLIDLTAVVEHEPKFELDLPLEDVVQ